MGTGWECISCGSVLVQDPNNPQWKRCLQCEPDFARWMDDRAEWLAWKEAKLAVTVLDKVGKPTRYGVRQ